MLYVITHLKAPWPLGAVVGDVIELEAVPVWAAGKCKPAEEGAEATVQLGDEPEESKPLDKAAIKAEAKALGLEFDGRISADDLAELIAAYKAQP